MLKELDTLRLKLLLALDQEDGGLTGKFSESPPAASAITRSGSQQSSSRSVISAGAFGYSPENCLETKVAQAARPP